MARVLVLGAGFAGLAAAYGLRRLAGDRADVTVLCNADGYFYRPSLPEVALGNRRPQQIVVPLEKALSRKGIRFAKCRVTRLLPTENGVEADIGRLEYDYLIVALGSEIAFDEIPGAAQYGHVLCESDRILALREAIASFRGGDVAIALTPDNPFELVDIGFTFALDHLLRRRGIRDTATIRYFTHNSLVVPHLGERGRATILDMFRRRNIAVHSGLHLCEVTPDAVVFDRDVRFPAALTVLIPPYRGRRLVATSDMADERGYIKVDDGLRSSRFDNVYAAGDSVYFAGPKTGRRAVIQGKVVAHNIASNLCGRANGAKFVERDLRCIVEAGAGRAALIRSNVYWGGTAESVWLGRVPLWLKVWLEKRFLFSGGNI